MWSLIGDWSGAFDLRRPTVAKVWSNDEGQQWWSGQAASGRVVSLVSLYLSGCVFDWLHSHRFLYAPVRLVVFFSGVEGGWVVVVVKGGGVTPPPTHTLPPPPLFLPSTSKLRFLQMASAAHTSALCANHAHRLQIFCLSLHTHTNTLICYKVQL